VNWKSYELVIENVSPEDGGGYRIFYPTWGYAVYGVGNTLPEAMDGLSESQSEMERFILETPEYCPPSPTARDAVFCERLQTTIHDDFAYAA